MVDLRVAALVPNKLAACALHTGVVSGEGDIGGTHGLADESGLAVVPSLCAGFL